MNYAYSKTGTFQMTLSDKQRFTDLYVKNTISFTNYYADSNITIYNASAQLNFNDPAVIEELFADGTDLTDCTTNCSSNGVCVLKGGKKYGCKCFGDYIGDTCSVNSKPCANGPCINNGTCTDSKSTGNWQFNCTCVAPFSGKYCQVFSVEDICKNLTCLNGVCNVDRITAAATCKCFNSYSGSACDTMSESLKTTKNIILASSTIAIIFLVLFNLFMVSLDIMSHFCMRKAVKKPMKITRVTYTSKENDFERFTYTHSKNIKNKF